MRSPKNKSIELDRDRYALLAASAKELGVPTKALLEAIVERAIADTRPLNVKEAERHLRKAVSLLEDPHARTDDPSDDEVIRDAAAVAHTCALALDQLNRDPERLKAGLLPAEEQSATPAQLLRWWTHPDELLTQTEQP